MTALEDRSVFAAPGEAALPSTARIGPNAVLQLVPVLDAAVGPVSRAALMRAARVALPPPDAGMLPEDDVARLHTTVRRLMPDDASRLLRAAGLGTADYILAHRIPPPAQWLIGALPGRFGARVLAAAIAKHAWTFAGSGRFRIAARAPLTFEIADNPLAREPAGAPVCVWHEAVFDRLFSRLISPRMAVRETACCACGDPVCRFELHG